MTCRDVIEFLNDYVSGAVSPRERELFEAHLAVCPACVAFLQNYRQVLTLTKDAVPPASHGAGEPVPEELVQAILAARQTGA